jgi:hypothetical protein
VGIFDDSSEAKLRSYQGFSSKHIRKISAIMSRGAVIGLSFFLGLFCVVHTANGKSVDPTLIRRLGTEHEVLSCGGCTWSLTANGTLRMTGTSDCGSGCPSRFDFNDLGITTIDPSAFNSTGLQHATTL